MRKLAGVEVVDRTGMSAAETAALLQSRIALVSSG
jgi:hypothetical protein